MVNLISVKDLKKLKDSSRKIVLLDVRTASEFESEHIDSAINLPLDLVDKFSKKINKLDKDVIVICKSGNRAKMACSKFDSKPNIRVLEGGTTAWIQNGFETQRGKQMWDLERQVRFVAGLLVLIGFLLGWFLSKNWFILSGFVGAGLVFASVTNTCAMGMIISKMFWNKSNFNLKNFSKLLDKLN